jgi:predicted GIY-YIG superfamily endonuclease
MSKDPAFLFYPNDYLGGTMGFSFEQHGMYIMCLILQFNNGPFSYDRAQSLCIGKFDEIKSKFTFENDVYFNKRLGEEINKRVSYCESRRKSRITSDEDSVRIYMVKDNTTNYIKIGSSCNPDRRFKELCNQKNPAITVGYRDYNLVFVSEIVERSTEGVIHEKFKEKRIKGEWFSLNEEDINYVRKTYGPRTENENENRNENEVENRKSKISRFVAPSVIEVAEYCNERKNTINPEQFIDHYSARGWMLGKQKMKDWKAAVRTWEKNNFNKPIQKSTYGRQEVTRESIKAILEMELPD